MNIKKKIQFFQKFIIFWINFFSTYLKKITHHKAKIKETTLQMKKKKIFNEKIYLKTADLSY